MLPRFEYGAEVRVIRNVRNDGTFPGFPAGALLVRRGSVGFVRDVGSFLQDQIIYTVHFLEDDRIVGCREEELLSLDEPWVPSRFEFRDKVTPRMPLGIRGKIIAGPGAEGEVLRVRRDLPEGVVYHVRFPGITLQVPESALEPLSNEED
jgi:nitrogen fixation protein NifZ